MAEPKKRIKVKEHENLSDSNVQKVIDLLESSKPITKKDACEILNISYNTTRLTTIIENYKSRKEYERSRRESNKGAPLSESEITEIIISYLKGDNVSSIANVLFRSASAVKALLDRVGVPCKLPIEQRIKPAFLPDMCYAEEFKVGQTAWSAKYHGPCEIVEESCGRNYEEKYNSKCYKIYVYKPLEETPEFYPSITTGGFYAYSLAYDLGSLEHLEKYGVLKTTLKVLKD